MPAKLRLRLRSALDKLASRIYACAMQLRRPGFRRFTGIDLAAEVYEARLHEWFCRHDGQFDHAVRFQQYADALSARGEVYDCELARAAGPLRLVAMQ